MSFEMNSLYILSSESPCSSAVFVLEFLKTRIKRLTVACKLNPVAICCSFVDAMKAADH